MQDGPTTSRHTMQKPGNRPSGKGASKSMTPAYRADHLAAVQTLLANIADVREGSMFGYPAFYVGRRLFACLYEGGVGLKVPERLATYLVQRGHAIPFRPYGKPKMREWIQINHACSRDYEQDRDIFLLAATFVSERKSSGASR
jgi:TfoX/Sxy family transcriptional regulator of competence genes